MVTRIFLKMKTTMISIGAFLCISVVLVDSLTPYTCDVNPYTDGCSTEFYGLDFDYFYEKRFTPACQRHDVCYACGSGEGRSREDCDKKFRADMKASCRRFDFVCKFFADQYYYAVRALGADRYNNPPAEWCQVDDWWKVCL